MRFMRLLNELSRQQKTRTAVISTGQFNGAGEESRTPDLRITNALLYQLSYTGNQAKPTTRLRKQSLYFSGENLKTQEKLFQFRIRLI